MAVAKPKKKEYVVLDDIAPVLMTGNDIAEIAFAAAVEGGNIVWKSLMNSPNMDADTFQFLTEEFNPASYAKQADYNKQKKQITFMGEDEVF
jgi:hypothetical protein